MVTTTTVAEANVETQRRLVAEVWNDRNPDAAHEFFAEGCVAYDPTAPEAIRGPEGYAAYVRDTLRAFPNFHVDLHAVVADGNRVMTHYTVSGKNDGPFGPLPPTGRFVEMEGMSTVRYVDGRIIELREFVDTAALRRQLGLSFPAVLLTLPRLALREVRRRR
ncbi:ester cyclase [Halomarina salina]|uniref:Ester cyclase n=1 Tax=Halomarina salina TaxID=1872699 RepID=A0ABD5RMX1_9EURY|nr:ester cyclase [Halomarina salina]